MVEEVWHPVLAARAREVYLLPPDTRKNREGRGFMVKMLEEDAPPAVRGQLLVSTVEFECVEGDWFPIGKERLEELGRVTLRGVWHSGGV